LDVGGTSFSTTVSTLLKYSDSHLSNLVLTGSPSINAEGRLFVDRDGTHFRYILNFLRDNELELPNDEQVRRELLKEASFYGLQDLVKLMEKWNAKYQSANISPTMSRSSSFTQQILSAADGTQMTSSMTNLTSMLSPTNVVPLVSETPRDGKAVEEFLRRSKEDLEQLMKMLDYSQKLRQAMELEMKDLRAVIEQQKAALSNLPNSAPQQTAANANNINISLTQKMEQEIVELQLEVDRLKKSERKAVGQKAKLKEEIKHMEEEIEILKSVIDKEKTKLKDELFELSENLEMEKKNSERQRKHLESEIHDLKEQIEERDQIIDKQKKYFEMEVKDLRDKLLQAGRK